MSVFLLLFISKPAEGAKTLIGVKPRPCPQGGVCFADGRRRVDYVLVYHCKRRFSIVINGNLSPEGPAPLDPDTQTDQAEVELEVGVASGPGEKEKALIREEFEHGLLEQGLEIERDVE
ncbi:anoctamin-1 isoform X1, partial [Tachysurus ichikawai]